MVVREPGGFDMLIGITDSLLSLLPVKGEMAQLVEECWPLSNCQNLGEMELLLETSHQKLIIVFLELKRERESQWESLRRPWLH